MKIATWNVNGIRKRYDEVVAWVTRDQPDVFCLQEIKASSAQVPDALIGLAEYWNYWHGSAGGYSGVSLHVRRDRFGDAPSFSHPSFDMEARIVQVALGQLIVASVYVPNGGKDYPAKIAFLKQMQSYAASHLAEGRSLVICGDLNVARTDADVHPNQRKLNAIGQRPEERALIEAILAEGLTDVGRALRPEDDAMYSWWAPWREHKERNIGWRLDYVCASNMLAKKARTCPVLKDIGTSDHAPVMADFE